MEIKGKVAIVTGAAAGIGLATVNRLIEGGAVGIIAADIDGEGLKTNIEGDPNFPADKVCCAVADVSKEADIEELFRLCLEKFGQVDILVNNAGIVTGYLFPDLPIKRLRQMVEINLLSMMVSTVLASQHMKSGGAIVNIASTASFNPNLTNAPYSTTKAAVIMFTQSCKDLEETHGIRVNAVCPGITNTAILEKAGGGEEIPPWLASAMVGKQIWKPSDIADAVAEVIHDDSMSGDYRILRNSVEEISA